MATLLEKDYETEMLFDMEHNLSEYNNLTRNRYRGAEALESYTAVQGSALADSYTPMKEEPKFVPVQLDGYAPVERFVAKPFTTHGANTLSAGLESYAPRPINMGMSSCPTLESYTKLAPVGRSAATFRPELVDFADMEVNLPKQIDPAFSLIADMSGDAEEIVAQIPAQQFVSKFRLNAVGMVAVVSFVAVAIMIFAFIISNAVAISGGSARIATLQASNAEMVQSIETATLANDALYAQEAAKVAGVAGGMSYVAPTSIEQTTAWQVAATPKANTNMFNEISKFFSKIF